MEDQSEIEKIVPPKMSRGRAISFGKRLAKLKRAAGINEELLGSNNPWKECETCKAGTEWHLKNNHERKGRFICESCFKAMGLVALNLPYDPKSC